MFPPNEHGREAAVEQRHGEVRRLRAQVKFVAHVDVPVEQDLPVPRRDAFVRREERLPPLLEKDPLEVRVAAALHALHDQTRRLRLPICLGFAP